MCLDGIGLKRFEFRVWDRSIYRLAYLGVGCVCIYKFGIGLIPFKWYDLNRYSVGFVLTLGLALG